MTVIVLFNQLGIGISDVMLTVDGSDKWPYLPSIGEPSEALCRLPFHPTRLAIKVAKLAVGGQNTPFLVAGTLSHIQGFLEMAAKLARGGEAYRNDIPLVRQSPASVLTHAAHWANDNGAKDLCILGLRGEQSIATGMKRRSFSYFGDVMLGGSGAPSFEQYLEHANALYEKSFPSDSDNMKGYRVQHYLPMQLLNADRLPNSPTLPKGVGGFYEVYLNYKGKLDPDNVGWIRILADFEERKTDGIRLRAFWWHMYDEDELIVASAPREDLPLCVGKPVLLPIGRIRVDRIGGLLSTTKESPPDALKVLPRIAKARFLTSSMRSNPQTKLLVTHMGTPQLGPLRVAWSKEGLTISLDQIEFAKIILASEQGTLLLGSVIQERS